MERPELKEETSDGVIAFVGDLLDYCDILEEIISALRDDYAEQVKVTAELRRKINSFLGERYDGMSEQYNTRRTLEENPNGTSM